VYSFKNILIPDIDMIKKFNDYQKSFKDKLSTLSPFVKITNNKFEDLLSNKNANMPDVTKLTGNYNTIDNVRIGSLLNEYGLYNVQVDCMLYNIEGLMANEKFYELIDIGSDFNLIYGWNKGKYELKENTLRTNNGYSDSIRLSLRNFKIEYVGYKKYRLKLFYVSTTNFLNKNAKLENIGLELPKKIKIEDKQGKNKVHLEAYRFGDIIKEIVKKLKLEFKNKNVDFSNIEVNYEPMDIADEKLSVDVANNMTLRGNITSVLENLINSTVNRKYKTSFYINEGIKGQAKTLFINFFDYDEFYDQNKNNNNLIELTIHGKDSFIESISFDTDEPSLYGFLDNLDYIDKNNDVSILKPLETNDPIDKAYRSFINKKLKKIGDNYTNYSDNTAELDKNKSLNDKDKLSKNTGIIPKMMLYSIAKMNLSIKGFAGLRPGMLIKLNGDVLFEGTYIILNIDHYLSQDDGFKSDLNLIMFKPNKAIKRLFTI